MLISWIGNLEVWNSNIPASVPGCLFKCRLALQVFGSVKASSAFSGGSIWKTLSVIATIA